MNGGDVVSSHRISREPPSSSSSSAFYRLFPPRLSTTGDDRLGRPGPCSKPSQRERELSQNNGDDGCCCWLTQHLTALHRTALRAALISRRRLALRHRQSHLIAALSHQYIVAVAECLRPFCAHWLPLLLLHSFPFIGRRLVYCAVRCFFSARYMSTAYRPQQCTY